MKDLVLIMTYQRPEYLWHCLDSLVKAEGRNGKDVAIFHDHHPHDTGGTRESLEVFKDFVDRDALSLVWIDQARNSWHGNSFNTLEAYRWAFAQHEYRYVYLIEDDLLVANDFFKWHETVQASGNYFCTVGRPCPHNRSYVPSDDPSLYCVSSRDYASLGVCWKRENLDAVVAHANAAYYGNMVWYCRTHFPSSNMGSEFTEQDGLIERVVKADASRLTAFPCRSRVFHIGVTGYHRPNGPRFHGAWRQRADQLGQAMLTGMLARMRKDFVELNDIDQPRPTPEWSELKVSQRF